MTGEQDWTPGSPFSQLTQEALDTITSGHCPQCKYRGFVIGPRGGMAINIECGNPRCRSRYNITFYAGRAVHGHDLFDGRSAVPWPSEPPPARYTCHTCGKAIDQPGYCAGCQEAADIERASE